MDLRIGVTHSPRELTLELDEDTDRDELRKQVDASLEGGMLWLTDRKGREVAVPADKIAYVELGAPGDEHRIGFGST
ncbi:MAG: DUF3107 domain-containing protein [Actinomycetota bacterium]